MSQSIELPRSFMLWPALAPQRLFLLFLSSLQPPFHRDHPPITSHPIIKHPTFLPLPTNFHLNLPYISS